MLVLMLSVLLTQAGEPAAASLGLMLPVGQVSPEDVELKTGTTVLALCGKELKEVPLTVKEFPSSTDEYGIFSPATKDLSVPCAADLLFYKVPQLKPGAVQPVFEVKREDPSRGTLDLQGTPLSFSVGGKDYQVVQKTRTPGDFRVFLVDGKQQHLLYELRPEEGREGSATLLWAGDMNQDGRPDVVLMAGGESRQISLFMSGKGSKGPRKVATYEYSGLD